MRVTVDRRQAAKVIDALIERRKKGLQPYDSPRASVPQELIPEDIRKDKRLLARFYFFVCIYMRGGVESHTAFRQLLKMWRAHPELFDAFAVSKLTVEYVQSILKEFVGWDSKNAGTYWHRNAVLLTQHWGGEALSITRNLTSYEEAVRRIARKSGNKGSLDAKEEGFWGFQHKMVSMLLYFFDWEKLLTPRFAYPSPADFHHYRILIATKAVVVETSNGVPIRFSEKVSRPIRETLMWYLKSRGVDPIILADALWLFSLLLCGESPATMTKESDEPFHPRLWGEGLRRRFRKTCGRCPFASECEVAIPAKPYYRRGQIVLRKRPTEDEVESYNNQLSFTFPGA